MKIFLLHMLLSILWNVILLVVVVAVVVVAVAVAVVALVNRAHHLPLLLVLAPLVLVHLHPAQVQMNLKARSYQTTTAMMSFSS